MYSIRSTTRMSLSIGIGCASVVWVAASIGMIANPLTEQTKTRISSARNLAVNVASVAQSRQLGSLPKIFQTFIEQDESIRSIGVKKSPSDRYFTQTGLHSEIWDSDPDSHSANQIAVKIHAGGRDWGVLEIAYRDKTAAGNLLWMSFPIGIVLFAFAASSLFSWMILAKSLRYLDPTNVVPSRVRSALDTLAEGLVLINADGEIAHANDSFRRIVSIDDQSLLGRNLESFGWQNVGNDGSDQRKPWDACIESKERIARQILTLTASDQTQMKFAVSASPIYNGDEKIRGAMISFDDVTELQNKNHELANTIGSLRSSRDEVARQNKKLNFLASYDPLTECLNRRAFLEKFAHFWSDESCTYLNLLMLDVDFFKRINDTHGHSVGDEVLVLIGHILRQAVGERGVVCRYGGEEFVILVPGITVDQCEGFSNDLRKLIEQAEVNGIRFTTSIGLSCREFIPMDPQHLLDQADESLYLAKRSGRNRVVRFDQRAHYLDLIDNAAVDEAEKSTEVPYAAVTGLLSALSFRCAETAQHSLRVADLCVSIGKNMMSRRELYRLEVSALLHDIGKIGVPDSILHKPTSLTEEEWKLMKKHDLIGAEIVRNALSSEAIAQTVESHHGLHANQSDGTDTIMMVPLAAKIISACDAFDAMTNDRVYRKAMAVEDALLELERNAPTQFDPKIVKVLCEQIRSGKYQSVKNTTRPGIRPKLATAIGQQLSEMYDAVADEDIDKLKSIVQTMHQETSADTEFKALASQLDGAVNNASADNLDEVLELLNDVMQLCRESRRTLVSSAESIKGADNPVPTQTIPL